jgi:dipeptidyl aminopeptidase/acylaminoacyl peptidase
MHRPIAGLFLCFATIASAQQPVDSARPLTGASGNRFASLPYGAMDEKPVSRWTPPASAGRQLTLNDLLTWKQIRNSTLSNDGKWFAYILGPNEGDAEVVIRGTAADGKEWRFPVGDAAVLNRGGAPAPGPGAAAGNPLLLSGNSRWAAFLVYPSSATPRRRPATGPAAPAAPTRLAVVDLANGVRREFENVRSFRFAGDKSDWLAIHHAPPTGSGAAGGGGGGAAAGATAANPAGTVLELVNLAGGTPVPIANVSEFAFDDSGDWIAYAVSVTDQLGNGVQLRQLSTGLTRSLDAQKASYRRIAWADSSTALAALRIVTDTTPQSPNEEQVTALLWPQASASPVTEVGSATPGIPAGLVLSADYAVSFGRGAKLMYLGLREPRPPRPRAQPGGFTPPGPGGTAPGAGNTGQVAAAPQTDAEVPSLILWHWKDPRTQATQQVQENVDRSFAFVASYDIAAKKVSRLTDDKARSLQRGPRDIWGILSDDSAYERDASIRGFAYRDLYAVNLATGARRLIQQKVPGGAGGGFFGTGSGGFAPDDSRYAYYDTGDWKVYDFAKGTIKTITEGVNGKFWDTEDDHNQVKPPIPGGLLGWSRDGNSVIVRDNWDLWRLPVTGGPAVNLTGNGQKDQVRYQSRLIFDPRDRRGIDLATPLYVETFEEWTKREGLVQVDPLKGGVTSIALENAKVDYRRARDARVWLYTRQTVVTFPDVYAADEGLRNERRLTDANPQQKEVAWTPGAILVDYTCDNGGGKHQAVLYLPAGYEKGKAYPTLTYIYELLSQEYNVYSQPNATRYSNPSVFTSRGYAFLKPDIVYHINDPGRSALWCIVPAVKAAIATGVVDPARVGLQGHSWGGYQTAFVTTQTDVFKAAVAGAPLTDLISMFGSIYWNTGNTDGSIFIASQGRFTGGPNEVPEAYLRNSPQTFADKLSIPLMILHNDRDGAVDFNQGITYYNHLRQLDKEVVLLEYVGENHGLSRAANQKDYALRLTEWFDTFLRDQPAPRWLEEGIPRLQMEAHLKDRRPMVDATAETERPRPIP